MEAPARGASPPLAAPVQGTSQHLLVSAIDEAFVRDLLSMFGSRSVVYCFVVGAPWAGNHHSDRSVFRLAPTSWSVGSRSLPLSGGSKGSSLSNSDYIYRDVCFFHFHVPERIRLACAILGYVVVDDEASLIVATKVKELVVLPGGHSVYTIVDSRALRIPLWRTFIEAQPNKPKQYAELLRSFPFENAHYYSETSDVTQPFPSAPVLQQNWSSEFCWNAWLTESFARAGLREWCACIVQGVASARIAPPPSASNRLADALKVSGGQSRARSGTGRERSNTGGLRSAPLHIALFTRRSRLNPAVTGGLNAEYGPANETEYELIGWVERSELRESHWASFVWRSGTAPFHWSVEPGASARSGVAHASFSHAESAASSGEPSVVVRSKDPYEGSGAYFQRLTERYDSLETLSLFNLLSKKLPVEAHLSNAYHECLALVRTKLNISAELIDFDWTQSAKRDGPNPTVEGLWGHLKPALSGSRLTLGQTSLLPADSLPAPAVGRVLSRQSAYLRFNSFSSTNRAGVAMLFVAYQAAAEISRTLGFTTISAHEMHALQAQRWPYLEMGLPMERLAEIASRASLDAVLELFQAHSDVVSLFCSQPSLATFLATMTAPATSSSASAPQARTSVTLSSSKRQRSDKEKNLTAEAVLGLRSDLLSSTLNEAHAQLVSGYPAFPLLPLYSSAPSACPFTQLRSKFSWHAGSDCATLEVVLTIPSEEPDNFPLFMDVCSADYVENAQVMLQKVRLARADKGTRLYYPLPSRTERMQANHLYKFHDDPSPYQRIIHFIFYAQPGCTIALGRVDVLGVVEQAPNTAQETLASLQQKELVAKVRRLASVLSSVTPGTRESEEAPTPLVEPFPLNALDLPFEKPLLTSALSIIPPHPPPPPTEAERSYMKQVQEALRKNAKPPITFLQALRVDLARLLLDLHAAQRDLILLRMGLSVDAMNPGLFVFHRDEREEAARRKAADTKTGKCYNCAVAMGLLSFKSPTQCTACYQYFCQQCMYGTKKRIIEFMWAKPYPVCKKCAAILTEEEDLLCQIQGLIARQKYLAQTRLGHDSLLSDLLMADVDCAAPRRSLYLGKDEETAPLPLLRFPSAGLVRATATHPSSPPAETLLFPEDTTAPGVFWHSAALKADILVALSCLAAVCRVGVQAGPLGFVVGDAPVLRVSAGESMASMQLVGEWRLCKDGGRATPLECREFAIDPPVVCRLLLFSLAVPPLAAGQGKRLHATRLLASGRPAPLPPVPLPASPSRSAKLTQHLRSKEDILEPININVVRGANKRSIDVTVALQPVTGFQLLVRHSEDGPASQARQVRVIAFSEDDGREVTLGVFFVPLVHSPSLLSWCFEMPQTFSSFSVQFIATYGCKIEALASHKVYLFSTTAERLSPH